MNQTFRKMFKALDTVEKMPALSNDDRALIAALRQTTREKYDELNGLHGFAKVADADLNGFGDYIVQDMEQASRVVIVTTTTVLIVLGVLILLLAL